MPAFNRSQLCYDVAVVARAWADIDQRARIVVDGEGLVLWLNAGARAMFSGGKGLSIRNRALTFASASLREAFDVFLQSLASKSLSTIEFPGVGSAENILVRAFRVAFDRGPVFCLELETGNAVRQITYANLENALGLTPTEHRVALALLDGGQPSEIAATYRISLETVRTHIKNIYHKVGVARNGAFHAALRHFQH